jgi:hypothetical protein
MNVMIQLTNGTIQMLPEQQANKLIADGQAKSYTPTSPPPRKAGKAVVVKTGGKTP